MKNGAMKGKSKRLQGLPKMGAFLLQGTLLAGINRLQDMVCSGLRTHLLYQKAPCKCDEQLGFSN